MNRFFSVPSVAVLAASLVVAGCGDTPRTTEPVSDDVTADSRSGKYAPPLDGSFTGDFPGPVFDIGFAPNGELLAVSGTSLWGIGRDGMREVRSVPTTPGSALNGVAAVGSRSVYVTSAGQDLALGAGVWRVTAGNATLVGDIEAFETAYDPDATMGSMWKNVACEGDPRAGGFTAGPQSNPYHLTTGHGGEVLVADAAGNYLLAMRPDGSLEVVAVFTPPTGDGDDWQIFFTIEGENGDPDIPCYVQPVPTAVAVGPSGHLYVGELTGLTWPEILGDPAPAWSRVWEIDPGVRGVECPSEHCRVAFEGFTSIVDVAMGSDGHLRVLEMDEAGWFTATTPLPGVRDPAPAGGTLNRCDLAAGTCTEVDTGFLLHPGAIAFDKRDDLWLVNSSLFNTEILKVGSTP